MVLSSLSLVYSRKTAVHSPGSNLNFSFLSIKRILLISLLTVFYLNLVAQPIGGKRGLLSGKREGLWKIGYAFDLNYLNYYDPIRKLPNWASYVKISDSNNIYIDLFEKQEFEDYNDTKNGVATTPEFYLPIYQGGIENQPCKKFLATNRIGYVYEECNFIKGVRNGDFKLYALRQSFSNERNPNEKNTTFIYKLFVNSYEKKRYTYEGVEIASGKYVNGFLEGPVKYNLNYLDAFLGKKDYKSRDCSIIFSKGKIQDQKIDGGKLYCLNPLDPSKVFNNEFSEKNYNEVEINEVLEFKNQKLINYQGSVLQDFESRGIKYNIYEHEDQYNKNIHKSFPVLFYRTDKGYTINKYNFSPLGSFRDFKENYIPQKYISKETEYLYVGLNKYLSIKETDNNPSFFSLVLEIINIDSLFDSCDDKNFWHSLTGEYLNYLPYPPLWNKADSLLVMKKNYFQGTAEGPSSMICRKSKNSNEFVNITTNYKNGFFDGNFSISTIDPEKKLLAEGKFVNRNIVGELTSYSKRNDGNIEIFVPNLPGEYTYNTYFKSDQPNDIGEFVTDAQEYMILNMCKQNNIERNKISLPKIPADKGYFKSFYYNVDDNNMQIFSGDNKLLYSHTLDNFYFYDKNGLVLLTKSTVDKNKADENRKELIELERRLDKKIAEQKENDAKSTPCNWCSKIVKIGNSIKYNSLEGTDCLNEFGKKISMSSCGGMWPGNLYYFCSNKCKSEYKKDCCTKNGYHSY